MSNHKLIIIIMVSIILIMVYTQCINNYYSDKSTLQNQTDIIDINKKVTLILNESSKTETKYNIENISNIQEAYTDEIMATEKYKDFSRNAELVGFHNISLLYKAASLSESIHANNHKAVLIKSKVKVPKVKIEFTINNTKKNLENNIKGEEFEASTSYIKFIKIAEKAGNNMAVVSFIYALKTEHILLVYYRSALKSLNKKTEKLLSKVFYVCPTCGNIYENNAPERCEFSLTKADKFIELNSYK